MRAIYIQKFVMAQSEKVTCGSASMATSVFVVIFQTISDIGRSPEPEGGSRGCAASASVEISF